MCTEHDVIFCVNKETHMILRLCF